MKPTLYCCLFALIASGCQHANTHASVPPAPVAATEVIPAAPAAAEPKPAPAYPAEYEEYYVGMICDDTDPTVAYRPGDLIVQTRPARFRLDGRGDAGAEAVPLFDRGPVTTARMANFHPDPTETEIGAIVTRAQRVIASLSQQNEMLAERVATLEKAATVQTLVKNPSDTAAAAAAGPGPNGEGLAAGETPPAGAPAGAEASDDDQKFSILRPDADYVIALDPSFFVAPNPTSNNPFVQLYQPPVTLHDVPLIVSAAMPGPKPSCILNDEPFSVGDKFEGLTVHRITTDTVYLRKDAFLLACPVSEKTLKLRLP